MIISAAKLVDLADILSLEKSGFLAKEQWSEKSWQEEITAEGRLVIVAKDADWHNLENAGHESLYLRPADASVPTKHKSALPKIVLERK